jgi:hypothetical protein
VPGQQPFEADQGAAQSAEADQQMDSAFGGQQHCSDYNPWAGEGGATCAEIVANGQCENPNYQSPVCDRSCGRCDPTLPDVAVVPKVSLLSNTTGSLPGQLPRQVDIQAQLRASDLMENRSSPLVLDLQTLPDSNFPSSLVDQSMNKQVLGAPAK